MSTRTLVELNHDHCPDIGNKIAMLVWARFMADYMRLGKKEYLPRGVTFVSRRNHWEPEPGDPLDPVLSELLRLSVEWREAILSEKEVARKAHAITRLWGQHGVDIVALARAGTKARDAEIMQAIRGCASLDTNGYICDKSAAMNAIQKVFDKTPGREG